MAHMGDDYIRRRKKVLQSTIEMCRIWDNSMGYIIVCGRRWQLAKGEVSQNNKEGKKKYLQNVQI